MRQKPGMVLEAVITASAGSADRAAHEVKEKFDKWFLTLEPDYANSLHIESHYQTSGGVDNFDLHTMALFIYLM